MPVDFQRATRLDLESPRLMQQPISGQCYPIPPWNERKELFDGQQDLNFVTKPLRPGSTDPQNRDGPPPARKKAENGEGEAPVRRFGAEKPRRSNSWVDPSWNRPQRIGLFSSILNRVRYLVC